MATRSRCSPLAASRPDSWSWVSGGSNANLACRKRPKTIFRFLDFAPFEFLTSQKLHIKLAAGVRFKNICVRVPQPTMLHFPRPFDSIGTRKMLEMLAEIPPHNPDRHTATDGFETPCRTNGMRASTARAAIARRYWSPNDDERESALDLFTNLMHLAHSRGIRLPDFIQSGLRCFLLEAGECMEKDGE